MDNPLKDLNRIFNKIFEIHFDSLKNNGSKEDLIDKFSNETPVKQSFPLNSIPVFLKLTLYKAYSDVKTNNNQVDIGIEFAEKAELELGFIYSPISYKIHLKDLNNENLVPFLEEFIEIIDSNIPDPEVKFNGIEGLKTFFEERIIEMT